jgi:dTDP-4-amino-4,6-dideoxygalactose transaminase
MGNIRGHRGGIEVQALEKEWCDYFKVKYAVAVNSASSGLYCALGAIGIKPGDEVIVTPYSMTISATVPLLFGAVPVFADIEQDYFCLDPKAIKAAITPKTKAIIVVDLFGLPYDSEAINTIANTHGIYMIEDAAQAAGAIYKDKFAGTLGDIGVFSLNVHKHIQCGEGGIVVTDNSRLAERLRLMRNHAEAVVHDRLWRGLPFDKENVQMVGMNLRMTELEAAIARVQLTKLEAILRNVRDWAKGFDVKVRENCTHAYYRVVRCVGENPTGYIKPLYRMPVFQSRGYGNRLYPTCEWVNKNITLLAPPRSCFNV